MFDLSPYLVETVCNIYYTGIWLLGPSRHQIAAGHEAHSGSPRYTGSGGGGCLYLGGEGGGGAVVVKKIIIFIHIHNLGYAIKMMEMYQRSELVDHFVI